MAQGHRGKGKRQVGIAALLGAGLLWAASALPQTAAPGPEVCQACHADYVASYRDSIHGRKGNPNAPANAGECAVCHANTAEHVKAGGGRGAGGIVNPGPRNKSMSA